MTTLTPLTSAELADLKAKAKAATPGSWRCCEPFSNFQKGKLLIRPATSERLIAVVGGEARFVEKRANGNHIAAANPETILRLIDMIERQAEQIERLRSALERTERNFRLSVAGKPVRDMGENLAENATAIAATDLKP